MFQNTTANVLKTPRKCFKMPWQKFKDTAANVSKCHGKRLKTPRQMFENATVVKLWSGNEYHSLQVSVLLIGETWPCKTFATVSSNFYRGILKHLPWCLPTFAVVSSNVCRGVFKHLPRCLQTFAVRSNFFVP